MRRDSHHHDVRIKEHDTSCVLFKMYRSLSLLSRCQWTWRSDSPAAVPGGAVIGFVIACHLEREKECVCVVI